MATLSNMCSGTKQFKSQHATFCEKIAGTGRPVKQQHSEEEAVTVMEKEIFKGDWRLWPRNVINPAATPS